VYKRQGMNNGIFLSNCPFSSIRSMGYKKLIFSTP